MLEECLNHLGTRIEQFRVVANVERSPGAHANHGQLFVSARKGLLAYPPVLAKSDAVGSIMAVSAAPMSVRLCLHVMGFQCWAV